MLETSRIQYVLVTYIVLIFAQTNQARRFSKPENVNKETCFVGPCVWELRNNKMYVVVILHASFFGLPPTKASRVKLFMVEQGYGAMALWCYGAMVS